MHVMMSWHVDASEVSEARMGEIEAGIKQAIEGYDSIGTFNNIFIIKVLGNGQYEDVQIKVMEFCQAQEDTIVRFIMTPLMNRGLYYGRVPQDVFDALGPLSE